MSDETDRKELARVDKKIVEIVTAIEDRANSRALGERFQKPKARQDELTKRLSTVPADIPDVNPNIAAITGARWSGSQRLSSGHRPHEGDEAAEAIRGDLSSASCSPLVQSGAGLRRCTASREPSSRGRSLRPERTKPTLPRWGRRSR